jgi:hypothetical protein
MPTYVAVIALVLAYVSLVCAYLALRTLAKLRRATALLSRGVLTGERKRTLVELSAEQINKSAALDAEIAKLRAEFATLSTELQAQIDAMRLTGREHTDQAVATAQTHLEQSLQSAQERVQTIHAQMLDDLTRIESDIVERAEQVRRATVAEVERGAAETEGALRHTALLRYDAFPGMSGRLSFSLALLDETGTGVAISALAGHDDTRVYAKGVTAGRGENELTPEEAQAVTAAASRTKTSRLARASAALTPDSAARRAG